VLSLRRSGGKQIDDLLDGFVGAVICGLQFTVWLMTGDRAVVATQALLGIGCCPRPASWGLAAIQAAGSTISLPSWIRSRRRGRRLAASGRPIAFGRASSLFLALAFKPRLRIRLCPKATLNPAVAAGKGDFHRESAGIIRDDLVIGHTPNMARPSVIPKLGGVSVWSADRRCTNWRMVAILATWSNTWRIRRMDSLSVGIRVHSIDCDGATLDPGEN
jgi:hypothetical protein